MKSVSGVLAVRALPGANCSSVGSVIAMLFAAGALGGRALVAVTVAIATQVTAFCLFTYVLRDALDPKLKAQAEQ